MGSRLFSLALRAASILVIVLFVAAVLLGRMQTSEETMPVRVSNRLGPVPISQKIDRGEGSGCRLFDPATGMTLPLALSEGEFLDHASTSPWTDDKGNWQIFGAWTRWSGSGRDRVMEGMGVVRLTYPEGRILDHVETEAVPLGPPCWGYGTRASVYFVSMNGQLFTCDFDRREDGSSELALPVPVGWTAKTLKPEDMHLEDVCSTGDPRLANRLVVSLSRRVRTQGRSSYTPTELWWLKLDDVNGHTVIGAGPLAPDRSGRSEISTRSPSLETTPQGDVLLGYYSRVDDAPDWLLHVAQIGFHVPSGVPALRRIRSENLGPSIRPDPPMISSDGASVTALLRPSSSSLEVIRRRIEEFGLRRMAGRLRPVRGPGLPWAG